MHGTASLLCLSSILDALQEKCVYAQGLFRYFLLVLVGAVEREGAPRLRSLKKYARLPFRSAELP